MNGPKLQARVRLHHDALTPKGDTTTARLVAFAELTIDDAFVIKAIRVMQVPGAEPFVAFPAQRGRGDARDEWYDLAHPCTVEARQAAVKTILEAFRAAQGAKA